jgi:hypothetical protein
MGQRRWPIVYIQIGLEYRFSIDHSRCEKLPVDTMTDHSQERKPSSPARPLIWMMLGVAVFFLISLIARLFVSWQNFGDLDHNAPGTWVALAIDAQNGLIYRPIVSSLGYGGTRYAPLIFVVQAALMRMGINPFTSGFLMGLAATALIIGGLFVLMRQLKTPAAIAAALAAFALAATCIRINILAIRGDLLPLGFSLWGLIAVVRLGTEPGAPQRYFGVLMGAALFALAMATKVTSVYGIATAASWLLLRRQFREAALLCIVWGAAMILIVLLTQWASGHRAVTIFRLCASGGGGLKQILHGPHKLLYDAWESDRIFLAIWLIAVVLFIIDRRWTSLPGIFLVLTTIGTAVVYGSPGTKSNHLADMTAASILLIAFQCLRNRALASVAICAVIVVVGLAAAACWRDVGVIRRESVRGSMQAVLVDADTSTVQGPILSEDPLLPILKGERPYLMDSFMLRALRHRQPSVADKLWDDLSHHYFRAVVLHEEPTNVIYNNANDGDFGPGFIDRVEQSYALFSIRGHFYIFLPKSADSDVPALDLPLK